MRSTQITLDLASGLTQMLADGNTTYLYGNGRLGQQSGGEMEYFLTDALGSVRQVADDTSIILTKEYEPYGEVMKDEGWGQSDFGFTGEWTSPYNEFVYLRARWYSADQGRFLTRDVWEGNQTEPMSYNAWLYVYANPVNYSDPSGYRSDDPPLPISVYCEPLRGRDMRACERILRGISPESHVIPDTLLPVLDFTECDFLPLRHLDNRLILPDLNHPKQYGWWYHWLLERTAGWWNHYGAPGTHVSVKLVTALSFGIETYSGTSGFRDAAKEAYGRKIWDAAIGFYSAVGGRQSVQTRVNSAIYSIIGDPPWDYSLNIPEFIRITTNDHENLNPMSSYSAYANEILNNYRNGGMPNRPWDWANLDKDSPSWLYSWINLKHPGAYMGEGTHNIWYTTYDGEKAVYVLSQDQQSELCGIKPCTQVTDNDKPNWMP